MFTIGNKENYEIDSKGINNLRGLAIDMIKKAESGHSGICLGAASIIYTLFRRHMNISLDNLDFVNRDRFILSAGHGAPLLYGILYMLGILELDDLKNLRKINSKTPGHPEYGLPLVEATTGPLGQGIANAVGLSMASCYLKTKTNNLIDYYTYVLCGDGELEEGITYEALSLAGTLKLNKLIVLCDSNDVTLDSSLKTSSTEDLKKRFESINFNVQEVESDAKSIDEAINIAKNSNLPSIIIVKTIIGEYSKNAGTNLVHGKPLDDEDMAQVKEKLGLYDTSFTVNSEVYEDFKLQVKMRGDEYYQEWLKKYESTPDKTLIDKLMNHENTYLLPNIDIDYENKSLRDLSGEILNSIAKNFDLLIGGSADLSSSCKTALGEFDTFSKDNYSGRNIYFGIREHAMGGILNGMALSGLRPFGSTFLTFSDYMKPSIRMSAMMNLPVLYIFTHDSITVGEDGRTHHPIEELMALEIIPNLKVYRPFDINELLGSYLEILKNKEPAALVLPRDNREISPNTKTSEVVNGMYVVSQPDTNDYINLLTNGEELGIVLELSKNLKEINIDNRVISVPCLKNVTKELKEKLLTKKTIGITLGVKEYFYGLTDTVIGINEFSLSGTKEEVLDYFGFTAKKLESKILELLNK